MDRSVLFVVDIITLLIQPLLLFFLLFWDFLDRNCGNKCKHYFSLKEKLIASKYVNLDKNH